jgi:DNA-binding CsgD family transcriptional regulator
LPKAPDRDRRFRIARPSTTRSVTIMRAGLVMIEKLMRLTGRQKQCLRLVTRENQSKMISRHIGISWQRVDKHISDAMRKMDVTSRFEAADILRRHEYWAGNSDQIAFLAGARRLGAIPTSLDDGPATAGQPPGDDSWMSNPEGSDDQTGRGHLRNLPTPTFVASEPEIIMSWLSGRLQNGLTSSTIIRTIGVIIMAGLFSVVGAISLLLVLNALVHG